MLPIYPLAVLFSAITINNVSADQAKPVFYPSDRATPLELTKEDYQPSVFALQGLTSLYINLDELIGAAQAKNLKLPVDLKAKVLARLEKAGLRLLSKEELEKTLGQPEMSMFPSYPKHLGPFKPNEPPVEYNVQCCTAGIWTSFTQGTSTLRSPLLNHKLATWGEGHNTTDCTDIGKWLGEMVLKTVDNFISAKQQADRDYSKWLAKQGQAAATPKATNLGLTATESAQTDTKSKTERPVVDEVELKALVADKTIEIHTTESYPSSSLSCDTSILLYAELFPSASATLQRPNITSLAKVADQMKACPQYRYRIETHADQRADDEYNEVLSARRAVAIRNYLVDHGVDEEQFELRFYGERKPLVAGNNEAAWAANRRVVVKPLKVKSSVQP